MSVKYLKSENERKASGPKVFLNVLFSWMHSCSSLQQTLLFLYKRKLILLRSRLNEEETVTHLCRGYFYGTAWQHDRQPLSNKLSSLPDLPFHNLAVLYNHSISTHSASSCHTGCVQHWPIVEFTVLVCVHWYGARVSGWYHACWVITVVSYVMSCIYTEKLLWVLRYGCLMYLLRYTE
jgi:hypothetical protein